MLRFKKVALTGGLFCGKSSVCRILKELGAYVVSADAIVHQLLSSDSNLGRKIEDLLGPQVKINNKLDRASISRIVFSNPQLLQALESLIHPLVYKEIDRTYQKLQMKRHFSSIFVAEVPLLFESGRQGDYEKTIVVTADREICLQRFLENTQYDEGEFNRRTNRQICTSEKVAQADYVITNNGTLLDLEQSTKELYHQLITSDQ